MSSTQQKKFFIFELDPENTHLPEQIFERLLQKEDTKYMCDEAHKCREEVMHNNADINDLPEFLQLSRLFPEVYATMKQFLIEQVICIGTYDTDPDGDIVVNFERSHTGSG